MHESHPVKLVRDAFLIGLLAIAMFGWARAATTQTAYPLSQALYVSGSNVAVFQKKKLNRSGSVKPNFAFSNSTGFGFEGVAFDSSAMMWVSYCDAQGQLWGLSQETLKKLRHHHAVNPDRVISLLAVSQNFEINPCGDDIQFDSAGNLWVQVSYDGASPNVLGYTPGQLTQTGEPLPSTTISVPQLCSTYDGEACYISDMKLDSQNDLWLLGDSVSSSINQLEAIEFTPAQLAPGGNLSLIPTLTLVLATSSTGAPFGKKMAFDPAGNLWVAYEDTQLWMYPASDLIGAGTIELQPSIILSSTIWKNGYQTIDFEQGIAFDTLGDLWVSSFAPGVLAKFTPDQLLSSGSPLPAAFIYSNKNLTNLDVPTYLTFGPLLPH